MKQFLHQKMKNVGFIALSGCLEKTVFHIVLHLLSKRVGFIALSGNRMKSTLVGFKPLPGFPGFSGFSGLLDFTDFLVFLIIFTFFVSPPVKN